MMRFSLEELTSEEFLQNNMERGDLIMERARREEEARVLERIIMRIRAGGEGMEAVAIGELEQNDILTVFPQFSKETKAGYVLKPHLEIIDEDGAHSDEMQKIREAFNAPADFDVHHPRYIRLLSQMTRDNSYQKCSVEQRRKSLWITREYWMPRNAVIRRGEPLILYKKVKEKGSYASIMVGGIQVLKGFSEPRIQAV